MISLVKPYVSDKDENAVRSYIKKVINGEETDNITEFENNFSKYLNVKYSRALNSGSSALHLALLSLKVGDGDEVICSTHTCVAILNAIKYVGAKPILVDIKYSVIDMNFNIDERKIYKNITNKTKVIIIPHMFGIPANIEEIKTYNIPIIEDGTLSLGAKFISGDMVGSIGDISIFSLHRSKMISADAGGVIATNNQECINEINNLLSYGTIQNYTVNYNYVMGEINSVLANEQLSKINTFIKMREENAKKITKLLSENKNLKLPNINSSHVYFRYLLELPEYITAEEVVKIGYERGVEFGRGVYPALHNYLGLERDLYANSEKAQRKIVSIPVYPGLTDQDIKYICKVLLDIISEVK